MVYLGGKNKHFAIFTKYIVFLPEQLQAHKFLTYT